jgi:hypothetical protein
VKFPATYCQNTPANADPAKIDLTDVRVERLIPSTQMPASFLMILARNNRSFLR